MTADHCTLWPDRLAGLDWSACCARHDLDYADIAIRRTAADLDLARCVADIAPVMAVIMFIGVALFGWLFRRRTPAPSNSTNPHLSPARLSLGGLFHGRTEPFMQTTTKKGRMAIAAHEAAVTVPYDDGIGVPTQGIGHTFRAGPPKVRWGGPAWPLGTVAGVFSNDLGQYEKAVRDGITRPMRPHEFDALTSFCFNVGPGNFQKSSVRRRFNSGGAKAAGPRLLLWNKAGGRVMAGLTTRRQHERAMLERGDYGGTDKILVYTRTNSSRRPIGGKLVASAAMFSEAAGERPAASVEDAMADGMLEQGERGGAVREMQDDLRAAGYDLLVDGVFLEGTEAVVREFQAAHNIVVDGKVGPQTFAALENAVGEALPTKPIALDTNAEDQPVTKKAATGAAGGAAAGGAIIVGGLEAGSLWIVGGGVLAALIGIGAFIYIARK